MKRLFVLLLGAMLCLFIACNPQPNDPPIDTLSTDTVLSKVIFIHTDSASFGYIDSSEFTYDNKGRIIKERYDGTSSGTWVMERSVVRDVNGIITRVEQVDYRPNRPASTSRFEVRYDYVNQRYLSKVVKDTAGYVIGSTSFEYTGNRFISLSQWTRYRIVLSTSFYYSSYSPQGRRLFSYNSAGYGNVLKEQQTPGIVVPWSTFGTQTLTFSDVINPLYNTDMFPFVARYCLEAVSSVYLSWDLESTSPYLPATQVYSGYPTGNGTLNLNFTWQYTKGSNNRPLMRKGKSMGQTVAVYYKYK